MLDVERYADIVKESGLKKVFIAQKLGLSLQGYLNKEQGKSDFTTGQVKVLRDLFNLSKTEISEIFLQ
jgi:DNA-binding XRE family transcriptional regulator